MNRAFRILAALAFGALVVAVPATAGADQPTKGGCPPGTWVLSDSAEWLAATEAGVIAEGSTMEEQAALFGQPTVEAFKAWIVDGVFNPEVGINVNGDRWVCRATNTPSGYPEFYFQVHDNKHHAKFG